MKTCFRIYMHSMSRVFLLARPSAHAETFCYKSVWMSAAKLPLGAFWLQLCPPGTHYVAKFYDCWFLQKNGREEKMNLITLIQQSSKAIVVFYFTLSFSPAFSFPPHCGTFGANFGLTRFLWLTKAKLVTPRAWGKSQRIQANQKSDNPLRKKRRKIEGGWGVAIEWRRAGSHSLRWNVPRSSAHKRV